ncbi:MAG: hypothetical protein AAFZ38_04115 [Myxococcota bacterium]
MRKRNLIIALCALAVGCSSDSSDDGGSGGDGSSGAPGGGPSEIRGSVHDPDLVPARQPPAANLLRAGDIENADDAWEFCGNARAVADNSSEERGQVLAFSGGPNRCGESSDFLETRRFNGTATQELEYDRSAEFLTVSLRVRVEGTLESSISLGVFLSNTFDRNASFFDPSVGFIPETTRDWIPMRWVVTRGDLDELEDEELVVLSMQAQDLTENATIYVDDVRVIEGIERTQPSTLPDELRDVFEDEPLVFINNDANAVSVVSGRELTYVDYPALSTEVISGAPKFVTDDEIALPDKYFIPEIPQDANIEPASGTRLNRYALSGGSPELIALTQGEPGVFEFSGSPDNVAALDFEIRSSAWNTERNLAALTLCGRNRSFELGLNSDDLCEIRLIDATTYDVILEGVSGFNAAWSTSGRLAYFLDSSLWVADFDGEDWTPSQVYAGVPFGIVSAVDFSPDGERLVFAEQDGGSTLIDGRREPFYLIKEFDLETGEARALAQIDQGVILSHLTWAPTGPFVLYSLVTETTEVWWLDTRDGTTGPLTNTLNASFGFWR